MTVNSEVIWVTGATSGIGHEMVMQLVGAGHHVIASGRNQEVLSALKAEHSNISTLAFDVTDASQIKLVRAKLEKENDHIDRVILNAGNCEYLDISAPKWDMIKSIMEVNFYSMVHCVEAALPLLKNAAHPHIVGICSQATQAPFPQAEAYGSSKAAARYFLESLRMDVAQFNIDVSVILPGFVDTPLSQKNTFHMPFLMPASQAATKMLNAIFRRKALFAFPLRLSLVLWVARHMPKLWLKLNSPPTNSQDQVEGSDIERGDKGGSQ